MRILESTVELVGGLFLIALTLLMGSCMVGSVVAALLAIGGRSATPSTRNGSRSSVSAEATVSDGRDHDIPHCSQTSGKNALRLTVTTSTGESCATPHLRRKIPMSCSGSFKNSARR